MANSFGRPVCGHHDQVCLDILDTLENAFGVQTADYGRSPRHRPHGRQRFCRAFTGFTPGFAHDDGEVLLGPRAEHTGISSTWGSGRARTARSAARCTGPRRKKTWAADAFPAGDRFALAHNQPGRGREW